MTFNQSTPVIVLTLVVIVSIVLIFMMFKARRNPSYLLKKALKPYINDEIKRIFIPDGIGGELEIEHLIAIDQGLLLIETRSMDGNVFGSDNIKQWSLIIDGGKSYKFNNPLPHLDVSRQALMLLAPKTPVFYRLVFTSNTHFPKNTPKNVSTLGSLSDDLMPIQNEKNITEQAQQAFNTIVTVSQNGLRKDNDG